MSEGSPTREELLAEVQVLRARLAELEAASESAPPTEQVLAALREGSTRRDALLRSALDAIVTIDAEGRVLEFNPAAERMFGHAREEMLGVSMAERIVPPAMRDAHHQGMQRYLSTGHGPVLNQRLELSALRADGEEFPVELTITPDRVAGVPVFTAYLRDLTERRRAEEALRQTELQLRESQKLEAVGKLAGGIAHDFNNLLTVILGCAEVLQFDAGNPAQVAEMAVEIQHSAERAAELTRQLLAFGKRQVLELQPVDLGQVLGEARSMLTRVIPESIRVATRVEGGPLVVRAEAGRLSQVLLNLAINARDAMPGGGELLLTARAPRADEPAPIAGDLQARGRAVLEVSDTGCGMSVEVAARAFEPFFTTKDLGGGSGLGLATVYGIVQQLEGAIELDSAPGRGTTVRLHLPLDRVGEAAAAEPRPGGAPDATTVLVVEDEEHVRRLVTRVLETRGHRVLVAEHGRAALEVARRHEGTIDLLLSDMVMPHLGGRDLAEQLKHERPELEVILMSGYSEDGRSPELAAGGRVHFLGKPFLPSDLVARVSEVLGGKD